jgi:Mn2+/Fe2+ NRAMP family transporter
LFIINSVTIVVELIGVEQSLSFFGMPSFWAVLLSGIMLFALMVGWTKYG